MKMVGKDWNVLYPECDMNPHIQKTQKGNGMPLHENGKCSSHEMFEKLMAKSIDNLADKIQDGINALNEQSLENGVALRQVLLNQSDRKELCGRQGARIDGLESSEKLQWQAISAIQKTVWMGLGAVVIAELLIKFLH